MDDVKELGNLIKTYLNKLSISESVGEKLKYYVYGIFGDGEPTPFYVGVGQNNRPLAHFRDAAEALDEETPIPSRKIERILTAFKNAKEPQITIFRHALETAEQAFEIEATLIDAFLPIGNLVRGYRSSDRGKATLEDLRWRYSAKTVNPISSYEKVFIFNIAKGIPFHGSVYEATRKAWEYSRLMDHGPAFAVGLKAAVSQGVYSFEFWRNSPEYEGKWEFVSDRHFDRDGGQDHELLNKNWSRITKKCRRWLYGGYLVVQFDGEGHFKVLHGSREKDWQSLEEE